MSATVRAVASTIAGIILGAMWWLFIDGYTSCASISGADCAAVSGSAGYAWLPPFAATLSFVMLNGFRWSELRDDMTGDSSTAAKARVFLLFTLLIAVLAIGGGAFVMTERFLQVSGAYRWAGISCFVSALGIVLAGFLMRFLSLPPADAY